MDRICKRSDCAFAGHPQAIGQFSKDATRPDGFHPYCKSCRARMAKKRAQSDEVRASAANAHKRYRESPQGKEYARRYYREHKQEYRARERARTKRPDVKAQRAEHRRQYVANNQLKECARKAVAYQLRKGRIERPSACEWCGQAADGVVLEAHHWKGYDPEHWLDVRFVHRDCHLACESVAPDDWS